MKVQFNADWWDDVYGETYIDIYYHVFMSNIVFILGLPKVGGVTIV